MTPSAKAVFDTNVLVRAVVDGAKEARTWMDEAVADRVGVVVPDLIYAESASALMRYVRVGRLALERALTIMTMIVELPFEVMPSRLLVVPAMALADRHGIKTYDAHYLALAEAEGAVLVTADRGLAAAATRAVLLT